VVSPAFADSTTGYKLESRRDLGVKSFALGFGLASGMAAILEILVALGETPTLLVNGAQQRWPPFL
jgi:hypothetical protein